MPREILDIAGKKFDQWKVLYFHDIQGHTARWMCECSCGARQVVRGSNLRGGRSIRCRECANRAMKTRKNTGEFPDRAWRRIVRNAVGRGIEFEVSREYLYDLFVQQVRRCALTGLPIAFSETARKFKDTTASLDRKDSSQGYIPGNVWWVHKTVNMMKQGLSVEDFRRFCRLVTEQERGDVGSAEVPDFGQAA